MRIFPVFIICLALLAFQRIGNKKKVNKALVTGTVTQTRDYCGGARPSYEFLSELATPKTVSGKKIYIKKGEVNTFGNKILLVATTDAQGNFQAKLKPGKYLVVDSLKKDPAHYKMLLKSYKGQTPSYEPVDTVCLKEWFMKPAATFEVTGKEIKNVSINFHITCRDVPCAGFRGPYPQ